MTRPVEIIAEIANAHQGDPEQARVLARAALDSGADAVKFQVYSAENLLVKAHPRYEHFRDQAFAPEVWRDLLGEFVGHARVYCDVFGMDALAIACKAGVHGLKIHSSDLGNDPLLEAVSDADSRLFLAVGGSTVREIAHAVDMTAAPSKPRPVLLHGFQSYPTAVAESCLNRIPWLAELFGERCDMGYMDHVDGDDPFAMTLPLLALSLGATVLEKHVTLNRAEKGVDYYSSLNPDEFARFVDSVRQAEAALVDGPGRFTSSERAYRVNVKKHWVAARPLNAGHVLEPDDLVMKRVSGLEARAVERDRLVGRALTCDVAEEQPLNRAHVTATVWACVVARMASTRLPGKALNEIAGMPALGHLLARLKQAGGIDRIVLCTTTESEDDALAALADEVGVAVYRGAGEDVLGRMLGALDEAATDKETGEGADVVLRVTGDDILVDPDYVDRGIAHHLSVNAEYTDLKDLPSGTEVELFDATLLRAIWAAARDREGTEYLTTYVTANGDQFRIASCPVDEAHAHDWRLTLDTPEDLKVITALLEGMAARGTALDYRLGDIVSFFAEHPEVLERNADVRQRQTPPEVCTDLDWSKLS